MDQRLLLAFLSSITIAVVAVVTVGITTSIVSDKSDNEIIERPRKKPNILFILLDDLGFNDVSWNNPDVHSPHMERLARSGVILDRNYAHTVCSPSRCEFLTGKYAHRLGVQQWVIQHDSAGFLPLSETLISERLRELNYSTHMIGKWHVGHCRLDYGPMRRGFDTFYGAWNGYIDSYTRCSESSSKNDAAFDWHDKETIDKSKQGVHVTDLMKDRALRIIEEADEDKPFFMFLSFPAPHIPIQVPEKYLEHYQFIQNQWRKEYLGMITHVDDAVGDIVATLKDKELIDNTIIVMSSDNGGALGPTSNYPLRGAKGSTYEGGQRVPGFITGPKSIIQKRGYITTEKLHMTDWFPTFIAMAGGKTDGEIDGVNQSEMLEKGVRSKRREIVYRINTSPSGATFGYGTISYDNYKLILKSAGLTDGWEQDGSLAYRVSDNETVTEMYTKRVSHANSPLCAGSLGLEYNFTLFRMAAAYGDSLVNRTLLFDIRADPEERVDLSEKMPEKVRDLRERLERHIKRQYLPPAPEVYPTSVTQKNMAWVTGWC